MRGWVSVTTHEFNISGIWKMIHKWKLESFSRSSFEFQLFRVTQLQNLPLKIHPQNWTRTTPKVIKFNKWLSCSANEMDKIGNCGVGGYAWGWMIKARFVQFLYKISFLYANNSILFNRTGHGCTLTIQKSFSHFNKFSMAVRGRGKFELSWGP